jgi:formylglycine-generating enzyme required for sulfatase activity
VWHGEKSQPAGKIITAPIHRLGCIAAIRKNTETPEFLKLIESLKKIQLGTLSNKSKVNLPSYTNKINRTQSIPAENVPEGMVYIPSSPFDMHIRHIRRECGCYLDQPKENIESFGYGLPFGAVYPDVIHKEIDHHIKSVSIKAFFIDETEVTNAQFKAFLDATRYQPKHPENFLKHWPDGKMPPALSHHPVVYVTQDDAKAYAQWAGKRLPTEAEWQLAAQGTDGRIWPWGNVFDSENCTTAESTTVTVHSFPPGRSPYGCYHMSGNVWEWTDTVYDDGYTRFTMIRGGSYYNAEGSVWYIQGGPRPCGHHAKFILTWPGMDRCSTVGFRCVKDVE